MRCSKKNRVSNDLEDIDNVEIERRGSFAFRRVHAHAKARQIGEVKSRYGQSSIGHVMILFRHRSFTLASLFHMQAPACFQTPPAPEVFFEIHLPDRNYGFRVSVVHACSPSVLAGACLLSKRARGNNTAVIIYPIGACFVIPIGSTITATRGLCTFAGNRGSHTKELVSTEASSTPKEASPAFALHFHMCSIVSLSKKNI